MPDLEARGTIAEPTAVAAVPCCPELEPCAVCDTIDVAYRLPFRPVVTVDDRRRIVPVQVTLRLRLTRCAGPVSVGDLIYSTTLLPGEQVRLFTSDRHSRFTFDSETSLAYRQEATSEESYFAAGMAHAMSNVSQVESSRSASSFSESSVSGGGGAGIDLGIVEIGGSVSGSSYDAQSLSTFARSVSRHAESSSRHVEVATRALSSTSVGEVETRSHREGESEDHFESASRSFANPNRCRALTFLFYKLVKCQQVRFELVAVDLEVLDPAAPTGVTLAPPTRTGGVGVIARPVVATSKGRLEVERAARVSAIEREQAGPVGTTELPASSRLATAFALVHEPLSRAVREAALAAVHQELVEDGLVDDDGEVTEEAQRRFGWTREIALPTPGVLVRGCLDDCDICEPDLRRERELDLQRKELENRLLERRIELLEKSQEYRCCPPGLEEDGEDG